MLRRGDKGFDPDMDCDWSGYASHDTWSIALTIENDSRIYTQARTFMTVYYIPELGHPFTQFSAYMHWHLNGKKTPEGAEMSFRNPHLNLEELDELMMEFTEGNEDGTADC